MPTLDSIQLRDHLEKKFPSLPKGKIWKTGSRERIYYNKQELGNDYTFYIDCSTSSPYIALKQDCRWHSSYPSQESLQHQLDQLVASPQADGIYSEFFELNAAYLPKLYVYQVNISQEGAQKFTGKLASVLRKRGEGMWVGFRNFLIADISKPQTEMQTILKECWDEASDLLQIKEIIPWESQRAIPPIFTARFIAKILQKKYRRERPLLQSFITQVGEIYLVPEYIIRGWSFDGRPVISISIRTQMIAQKSIKAFIGKIKLLGIEVINPDTGHTGIVKNIVGTLKDDRIRLLKLAKVSSTKNQLEIAPDSEPVIQIATNYGVYRTFDYPASLLHIVPKIANAHLFNAKSDQLNHAMTLSPAKRWDMIQKLVKKIGSQKFTNLNSLTFPQLFSHVKNHGYSELVTYGDGKSHPYQQYYYHDLKNYGFFSIPSRYKEHRHLTITILSGISSTLQKKIEDEFSKNLFSFGFSTSYNCIQISNWSSFELRKTLQQTNYAEADGILILCPNQWNDLDHDQIYKNCKGLLLTQSIFNSQVMLKETVRTQKFAVFPSVMGLLVKSGFIPFVLAQGLAFADYFVGIDISREIKQGRPGSLNFAAVRAFMVMMVILKNIGNQIIKFKGKPSQGRHGT